MKKLYIFITIIIIFAASFYLYYKEGTMPVNKNEPASKIFVIKKGENLNSIANNLEKERLIRNRLVFYMVVKKMGLEKKIQAGDFRLSPSMDAYTIAQNLTHGTLDIWVTIIEGLRKEEVAQIISKSFDIPESEFLKLAPEGYLFPDTYLIPKGATSQAIIDIFIANFEKKFGQSLKTKTSQNGLTNEEVVIIASLVEKEAKYDPDRQKVASIILKRYKEDWPLQIDATLQYAIGYQEDQKSWWKTELTFEDKKVDSFYNTYKNKGLPPTAICNPGLAALQAVIEADPNTPYWYYLSDTKGITHYAVTIDQHNQNIKKYLQ